MTLAFTAFSKFSSLASVISISLIADGSSIAAGVSITSSAKTALASGVAISTFFVSVSLVSGFSSVGLSTVFAFLFDRRNDNCRKNEAFDFVSL